MSGAAWVAIAIGLIAVAGAIVFGILNARRKTPTEHRVQEQATDRLYKTEPE